MDYDAQNAIEVRDLVKKYGDFTAVSNVNLTVRRGDFMGLLGPNGAGKSTTLKAVTGLLKPTSGSILIEGVDIKDHRRAMQHVGSIVETPEPYREMTPRQYLRHVGFLYGMNKEENDIRTRDVLEEMKMWDWRDKTIGSFSKGMKQRVVLAQALLPNPRIIILDEPTSGLDPRGMVEIRTILAELRKRDRSLLLSTHILSEVSEICGSVTVIRNGMIMKSGAVSDLINSNRSDGVALELRFMDEMPADFINDLSGCSGVTSHYVIDERCIKLKFEGTLEQQADLVSMAGGSGLRLLSINEEGANLESLYMKLTEGEGAS